MGSSATCDVELPQPTARRCVSLDETGPQNALAFGCQGKMTVTRLSSSPTAMTESSLSLSLGHLARRTVDAITDHPLGIKLSPPLTDSIASFVTIFVDTWIAHAESLDRALHGLFVLCVMILPAVGVPAALKLVSFMLTVFALPLRGLHVILSTVYALHLTTLVAFWRLFRGVKYNPMLCRIDHHTFAPDQVVIGCIVFVVLLFLLPTVLIFHVVLSIVRWLI